MTLLRIDSSARAGSVTRQLTTKFVEEWRAKHPTGEVIYRDLPATMLPAITDDWNATFIDVSKVTPSQRTYLSTSDALIEEVRKADTIVIGSPMYNFAISSLLKAWIDQIVRVGKTIAYGPEGHKGLLENKKVVVITARGGSYRKDGPTSKFDFQEPYLRHILGFIGLTDVTFIHAENQVGERAAQSFVGAAEQIALQMAQPR
jgi:FMN-dependent NADH-azoreductase